MANYSVVTYKTGYGSPGEVLAELETKIETVDDAKTIRLLEVLNMGNSFQGILIYDA